MDENTVNRTRASLNALIDIEQLWIENTPDYKLSTQDMLVLKKRLEGTINNVTRIYEDNKPALLAAEEEIKKMRDIEQFRFFCKDYYSKSTSKDLRNKTDIKIEKLAKRMELKDILDFWKTSIPGERAGAAVGIGIHLTISDKNQIDERVVTILKKGFSDSNGRVRFRVINAIGNNAKLVNDFKDELLKICREDEFERVRDRANEILNKYKT